MKRLFLLLNVINIFIIGLICCSTTINAADYKWIDKGEYKELNQPVPTVLKMQYSADSTNLYTYSADATIRTWDIATGKLLNQYKIQDSLPVSGFFFHSDGKTASYWSSYAINDSVVDYNDSAAFSNGIYVKIIKLSDHSTIAADTIDNNDLKYLWISKSNDYRDCNCILYLNNIDFIEDREIYMANFITTVGFSQFWNSYSHSTYFTILFTKNTLNAFHISKILTSTPFDSYFYKNNHLYFWGKTGNSSGWTDKPGNLYHSNESYNWYYQGLNLSNYNYSVNKVMEYYKSDIEVIKDNCVKDFFYSHNRNSAYFTFNNKSDVYQYEFIADTITNTLSKNSSVPYNVYNYKFTPNERYLTYIQNNNIVFQDIDADSVVHIFEPNNNSAFSMYSISNDSKYMITQEKDSSMKLYNMAGYFNDFTIAASTKKCLINDSVNLYIFSKKILKSAVWTINDNLVYTGLVPKVKADKVGQMKVNLDVTFDDSTTSTYTYTNGIVNVVDTLKANFSYTSTSSSAPYNVNFTNNSRGVIKQYIWDFGDGTTSDIINPSHTYNYPGVYYAKLFITDSTFSDSVIKAILINCIHDTLSISKFNVYQANNDYLDSPVLIDVKDFHNQLLAARIDSSFNVDLFKKCMFNALAHYTDNYGNEVIAWSWYDHSGYDAITDYGRWIRINADSRVIHYSFSNDNTPILTMGNECFIIDTMINKRKYDEDNFKHLIKTNFFSFNNSSSRNDTIALVADSSVLFMNTKLDSLNQFSIHKTPLMINFPKKSDILSIISLDSNEQKYYLTELNTNNVINTAKLNLPDSTTIDYSRADIYGKVYFSGRIKDYAYIASVNPDGSELNIINMSPFVKIPRFFIFNRNSIAIQFNTKYTNGIALLDSNLSIRKAYYYDNNKIFFNYAVVGPDSSLYGCTNNNPISLTNMMIKNNDYVPDFSKYFESFGDSISVFKFTLDTAYLKSDDALPKTKPNNGKSININISPNPANDYFKLDIMTNDEIKNGKITIYESTGNIIKSFNFENKSFDIDTKAFSQGIYYLKVSYSGKTITKIFEVMR